MTTNLAIACIFWQWVLAITWVQCY